SCSGHAHPRDLIRVIDMIEPKVLVPIHSFKPERLTNRFGSVLLPEKGQTI
ncbi:MAG: MBL fold metallo-hydrolase RNA specificity domain-containing protein, partial [Culicoidibacterales bacterium]